MNRFPLSRTGLALLLALAGITPTCLQASDPTGSIILHQTNAPPLLLARASGGGSENDVVELQVGFPSHTVKVPGSLRWTDLTVRRPLDQRQDLWDWRHLVELDVSPMFSNRDISLVLLDLQGIELGRRRFTNAWPRLIQLGPASETDPTLWETAIIVHEGQSIPGPNPLVQITLPLPNTVFWNVTSIVVRAEAQIPEQAKHLDFFAGANLIGTGTSLTGGEFSCTWSNPPVGSHTLSAVATDAEGEPFASQNLVNITVLTGLTFEQWRQTSGYFTPAELSAKLSGASADPDQDRLPNVFEYAGGTNPHQADTGVMPRLERSLGNFYFVYRRRAGGFESSLDTYQYADARYTVEFSPDLVTWTPAASHFEMESSVANADGVTETVSLRLLPAPASKSYLRLRIELLND